MPAKPIAEIPVLFKKDGVIHEIGKATQMSDGSHVDIRLNEDVPSELALAFRSHVEGLSIDVDKGNEVGEVHETGSKDVL